MAGTVTITEVTHGSVKKITFDWLSSSGGAADGTTTKYYNGMVERVVFIPDSGGTAPTALYDVTLKDDDGADLLDGYAADRSATVIEALNPGGFGAIANTKLTLGVTNAGSAKGGIVHVYLR